MVTVQRLLRAPAVGHLTAERELGRHLASVWDQFPEGTTLVMTLVARAQDRVGEDLARIERRAVGDAAKAVQARAEVGRARAEIARHNKLYPLGLALYQQRRRAPADRSMADAGTGPRLGGGGGRRSPGHHVRRLPQGHRAGRGSVAPD